MGNYHVRFGKGCILSIVIIIRKGASSSFDIIWLKKGNYDPLLSLEDRVSSKNLTGLIMIVTMIFIPICASLVLGTLKRKTDLYIRQIALASSVLV
jgi:hypothetical protein